MSASSFGRNPDLRCARVNITCGHRLSEHAPARVKLASGRVTRCFGVHTRGGVAHDCGCPSFVPPSDAEPQGRQQEHP